jgi:hypothetical protein
MVVIEVDMTTIAPHDEYYYTHPEMTLTWLRGPGPGKA